MSKDEVDRIEKARQKGAMCVNCAFFSANKHYPCDRFKERLTLNDMPLAYCAGYSAKE